MNIQHTQKNNTSLILIGAALIAGLVMGFTIGAVYAVELPASYTDTLNKTINATNQTEGHLIDNYMEAVKNDICETFNNNITAKQECLSI